MRTSSIFLSLLLLVLIGYSCTEEGPSGPDSSDFDRQAMLANWADNIIIPAFISFSEQTGELNSAAGRFASDPTLPNLEELRETWEAAYLAFQHVSMFEMGNAMQLRYRDNLNIYPTDLEEIRANIEDGTYNLELPSLNDSQGFPALDYLLHGLAESGTGVLEYYTDGDLAGAYRTYLTDLTTRINDLTDLVSTHWEEEYRDEFVKNYGNGANASVDMMVSDYIFYYEKALRRGKVGIPAGVSSGTPLSAHVEAYYHANFSKELLLEALDATQDFFNGKHFDADENGESLNSYLDFLNTIKDGPDLNDLINNQFDTARNEIQDLDDNFTEIIENDNSLMLSVYDKLQRNVVYLKTDMLQALNINVDYVDADSD